MAKNFTAEDVFEAAVFAAKTEAHLAPVEQRVTNGLIRRYAEMTGFDIESAARFVESELRG